MDNITELKRFKNEKKAKVIVKDLESIYQVLTLCINALSHFKKYLYVSECISVLQNNRTLIEVHIKKYKKLNEKTL